MVLMVAEIIESTFIITQVLFKAFSAAPQMGRQTLESVKDHRSNQDLRQYV